MDDVKVNNNIEEKYNSFLFLIKTLCNAYDSQESDVIALSISVAIRVLVHDKNRNKSLLKHIGKKECKFLSTNFDNKQDVVHLGLVRKINVGVSDGEGGEAKYWPLCDDRYFSVPTSEKYINFKDWWEKEEVFKSCKHSLTRKDLIMTMVNKDGGAHFDKVVDEKYDNFRQTWSGGSTLVGNSSGIKRGYDNIPTYPAVRQIAHELLSSLQPDK